jgi:hypothetical protein
MYEVFVATAHPASRPFSPGSQDCHPRPAYFSLIPRLKIKLKGRHFDTSSMHFKMAEALGTVNTRGGGLLRA